MITGSGAERHQGAAHFLSAALSGSIVSPNLAEPIVYSCPLYTRVSSGSRPSLVSAACISAALPACELGGIYVQLTLEEAAATGEEERVAGVSQHLARREVAVMTSGTR